MGRKLFQHWSGAYRHDKIIKPSVICIAQTLFFVFCICGQYSHAVENRFLASGTSRARALAMGGAYHSVIDDFSAGYYNPGAFKLNATKNERRLRIFLNPVASLASLYDYSYYDYDYDRDERLTGPEALISVAHLLKGLTFTTPVLDFGLGFGEEIIGDRNIDRKNPSRVVSAQGLNNSAIHSVFMNLKIANPVSIGIAGNLYTARWDGSTKAKAGYTFGVLLIPNPKMNVGIAYNQMPDDFTNSRIALESIESNSATGGISYYPDENTVVSIDLRTVNKEDELTSREIHAGLERRFAGRIALRAGYYREKATSDDVVSFGFGILPRWEKVSKYSNMMRNDIFSYSFIMEDRSFNSRWHVLSLLVRF